MQRHTPVIFSKTERAKFGVRAPLKSYQEIREMLDVPHKVLCGALSAKDAPQPRLKNTTTWYNAKEVQTWWDARTQKLSTSNETSSVTEMKL